LVRRRPEEEEEDNYEHHTSIFLLRSLCRHYEYTRTTRRFIVETAIVESLNGLTEEGSPSSCSGVNVVEARPYV